MKKLIEANELTDATVSHVSLVKRVANRAPLKIIKADIKETVMNINLKKLFKKDSVKPHISAVIVSAKTDTSVAEETLKQLGLNVSMKEETAEGVVYHQDEKDKRTEETVLVKLDDETFIALAGIKKGFYGFSGSSIFSEVVSEEGFVPGLNIACNALMTTVYNSMSASEDPTELASKIKAALDEFSSFVLALVGNVPVEAFKADCAMAGKSKPMAKGKGKAKEKEGDKNKKSKKKSEEDTIAGASGEDTISSEDKITGSEGEDTVTPAEDTVTGGAEEGTVTETTEADNESGTESGEKPEEVAEPTKPEVQTDEVLKAVKALEGVVTKLNESLGGIEKTVKGLGGDVKTINEALSKNEATLVAHAKALKGTVIGDSLNPDSKITDVKKTAGNKSLPPLLDTGRGSVEKH